MGVVNTINYRCHIIYFDSDYYVMLCCGVSCRILAVLSIVFNLSTGGLTWHIQ